MIYTCKRRGVILWSDPCQVSTRTYILKQINGIVIPYISYIILVREIISDMWSHATYFDLVVQKANLSHSTFHLVLMPNKIILILTRKRSSLAYNIILVLSECPFSHIE